MSGPVQTGKLLHGVSLPAFLQLLEHERTNCTLMVTAEEGNGHLFFHEGQLIDANYGDKAGLAAAHALLALNNPAFMVRAPEDRMARISQPLSRILLQADREQGDEASSVEAALPGEEAFSAEVKSNPLFRRLLAELTATPAVKHYCLLNRKGKLAACSSNNTRFCNLISYTVMCSLQMRKNLGTDVRGPQSIQMTLSSGDALLIQPGAGMIIGLLADGKASLPKLAAKIRAALVRKAD